jgi:excisionase family DNA binding protein
MSEIQTGIDEVLKSVTSTRPSVPPETITVEEAGKRLGVSRMTAYTAVKRGQIPSIRVGHRLVVPVAKLNAMLGADETQPREDDQPLSAA